MCGFYIYVCAYLYSTGDLFTNVLAKRQDTSVFIVSVSIISTFQDLPFCLLFKSLQNSRSVATF